MVLKFLVEDEHEQIYQKITVEKKIKYFQICNDIEKEEGEFIVAVDINDRCHGDKCCISKLHYNKEGCLVLDSSQKF